MESPLVLTQNCLIVLLESKPRKRVTSAVSVAFANWRESTWPCTAVSNPVIGDGTKCNTFAEAGRSEDWLDTGDDDTRAESDRGEAARGNKVNQDVSESSLVNLNHANDPFNQSSVRCDLKREDAPTRLPSLVSPLQRAPRARVKGRERD